MTEISIHATDDLYMKLNAEQRLAIYDLINGYGHIIDDREFSRLSEIFTDDAVFDLRAYGGDIHIGLEQITTLMLNSQEHPLGHHATNIIIIRSQGNVATVKSKGVGVGYKGRVGSVTYTDQVSLNNDGEWRISERLVSLRTSDSIPQPS